MSTGTRTVVIRRSCGEFSYREVVIDYIGGVHPMFASNAFADLTAFFPASCRSMSCSGRPQSSPSPYSRAPQVQRRIPPVPDARERLARGLPARGCVSAPPRGREPVRRFFQPQAITRYYSSQATPPTPTDVKRCDGASASDSACPTSRAPLCKEPRSPATATAPIARSSTTATSSPARNTPRQHMPGRGKAPAHRFGGIAAMRVIGPRPSSAAKIRSNY